MNDLTKEIWVEQLAKLQFSKDPAQCWQTLEKGVSASTVALFENNDNDLTPFSAWWHSCCELLNEHQIVISKVDYNGSQKTGKSNESDESIEIQNTGPLIVDLSGWRLNAGDDRQDIVFPQGTYILPQAKICVYTRKKGEFNFNSPQSVWNNKGDKAFLFNKKSALITSWSYGNHAHDAVTVSHINFDGQEKRTEGDEYVEITNASNNWVDIAGWKLTAGDGDEQYFVFPPDAVIKPRSNIRVYTNQIDRQSGGFSFASKTAVWNNKGDTGRLSDYKGKQVSSLSYGDAP